MDFARSTRPPPAVRNSPVMPVAGTGAMNPPFQPLFSSRHVARGSRGGKPLFARARARNEIGAFPSPVLAPARAGEGRAAGEGTGRDLRVRHPALIYKRRCKGPRHMFIQTE